MAEFVEAGKIPSLMEIYSFLNHLFVNYSPSCNIIALIYANRMLQVYGVRFNKSTWKLIWLALIRLTQKIWDDTSIKASEFIKLLPPIDVPRLRKLEVRALTLIRYRIIVNPSLYAEYYFELRKIFTEITGVVMTDDDNRNQHRLSTAQAIKIEAVSKTFNAKQLKSSLKVRKCKQKKRYRENFPSHSCDSKYSRGASAAKESASIHLGEQEVSAVESVVSSTSCQDHHGAAVDGNGGVDMYFEEYEDTNNGNDDFDINSVDGSNSIMSTIPWSPKIASTVPHGEPHGRGEHQQQRIKARLEQGSNTYEDITRNINIGALVLS